MTDHAGVSTRINQIHDLQQAIDYTPTLDENYPIWARRSNPIIRRQLGPYWRVFPPDVEQIAYWLILQALIVGITLLLPLLYLPVMILVLVSAVMFPAMLLIYVRALVEVADDATANMTREYQNDTLTVLRSTPFSAREIVLSKITAPLWRRMDAMTLTIVFTMTMGVPLIFMTNVSAYSPEDYTATAHLMTVAVMLSSVVRIPLEMAMVAALGVTLAANTRLRNASFMATLVATFFYFLLLNMTRLLTLSWPLHLLVEAILPVLLPLVILVGCVVAAERKISDD